MSALAMTRGDSKVIVTTLSSLPTSGLTGYSIRFTAKRDPSDTDANAAIVKTLAAAQIAVITTGSDTVPGVINTLILPGDTTALPSYTVVLYYDVQLVDVSGFTSTAESGTLTVGIDESVTNP